MVRIKIKDLPKDSIISPEELRTVMAGTKFSPYLKPIKALFPGTGSSGDTGSSSGGGPYHSVLECVGCINLNCKG